MLDPGRYTAIVAGRNNAGGIGLTEIYDVQQSGGRLMNISTRGFVGLDDGVMIGGVIITGVDPATVLFVQSARPWPALAFKIRCSIPRLTCLTRKEPAWPQTTIGKKQNKAPSRRQGWRRLTSWKLHCWSTSIPAVLPPLSAARAAQPASPLSRFTIFLEPIPGTDRGEEGLPVASDGE